MSFLMATICLLAHLLSCFFYLIGNAREECWFESVSHRQCTFDPSAPNTPGLLNGWVIEQWGNATDVDYGHRYMSSLYYTFNALEPAICKTDAERQFAIVSRPPGLATSSGQLGARGCSSDKPGTAGHAGRWRSS